MKSLTWLNITAAALMAISLGLVWFAAPLEATMGAVQKIFYFHLAAAWVGMVGFLITFGAGIAYLVKPNRKWDWLGAATAEVGLLLSIIATVTGSIWARPAWNTWWTWDVRLTTYTITILIYIAYLFLRSAIEDPIRRARFSAVYGIVGFISVPLTFLSIRLWQSIHPVVVGSASPTAKGGMDMAPIMTVIVVLAQVTTVILFAALVANRYRQLELQEKVEGQKARALQAEGDLPASAPSTVPSK